MKIKTVLMVLSVFLIKMNFVFAEDVVTVPSASGVQVEFSAIDQAVNRHLLSEYGSYKTIAQAKETLGKATEILIKKGGGVLVIPLDAPAGFFPRNSVQEAYNKPAVTVIDLRGGIERAYVPPLGAATSTAGLGGSRIIERDVAGTLPWQGSYATENIITRILGGSSSYMAATYRLVAKGKTCVFM